MHFINTPYMVLPRLTQEEAKYKANQISVNALSEEYVGIRYTDIINYSEWHDLSFNEALDDIISANEINDKKIVFLINEYAYYFRDNNILKEAMQYPIQFYYNGYNELSSLIESAIEQDIINETTDNTDAILNELFGNVFGLVGEKINNFTQNVQNKVKDAVQNTIDNIYTQDKREQVRKAAKNYIDDKLAGVVDSLKGNAPAIGKGVALGTMAFVADQMNAHPEKVKQTVIDLKNKLMNLVGLQKTAPPEKQGIIRRLIEKIKAILQKIGNKIGFKNN